MDTIEELQQRIAEARARIETLIAACRYREAAGPRPEHAYVNSIAVRQELTEVLQLLDAAGKESG